MAKYLGTDGKLHNVNITLENWKYHDCDYDNILRVECDKNIPDLFKHDKDLSDENTPIGGYLEIGYDYAEGDSLALNPIMTYVGYEKGFDCEEIILELTDKEKEYFQSLLTELIGDKHIPEMQKIMLNYEHSVDLDIYNFVRDVMEGREVTPITVGFVSEKMDAEISALTKVSTVGNRIILSADDVRHIIKRHGANGKADHSMEDIKDIARLSYVLANYDSIEWDGGVSNHYKTKNGEKAPQITIKKRVDSTYYVIQVVSDSSKKRNVITTAYLTKATE